MMSGFVVSRPRALMSRSGMSSTVRSLANLCLSDLERRAWALKMSQGLMVHGLPVMARTGFSVRMHVPAGMCLVAKTPTPLWPTSRISESWCWSTGVSATD